MFMLLSLIWNLLYTIEAEFSDACHGSYTSQTTNVLHCPRDQTICISGVTYYQWHISDIDCPHTINKHVFPRCCSHDPNKCHWAGDQDHVTKLQRICELARFKDGRCELLSRSPEMVRFPCYVDNIELSTTSSVRSINYTCVRGGCPRNHHPTTTTPRRRIPKIPPNRKSTITSITSLPTKPTTATGGQRNTTIQQTKQPSQDATPRGDLDIVRVTSRMISPVEETETDVGAIIGGIFGCLLVCLLLIGAFFFKRWYGIFVHSPNPTNDTMKM